MSIELPPLPPLPSAQSDQAEWARYLDIARLYVSREASEAVDRQTTQMSLMTSAATRSGDMMAEFLAHPVPASSGFSEEFVMSLLRLVLSKPEAP